MQWKQPLSIKEIINLVENENNNKQNNKQIAETFCYNVKNLYIPKDPYSKDQFSNLRTDRVKASIEKYR